MRLFLKIFDIWQIDAPGQKSCEESWYLMMYKWVTDLNSFFWEGWKPKSPSCARVSIYNTAGMRPIDEYWPPKLIQWTLATFYDHFKCTVTFSPDLELLYLEPKLLCTCSGHKRQLDKIGNIFSRWVWSSGWTWIGLKRISQTLERYRILRNTKFCYL